MNKLAFKRFDKLDNLCFLPTPQKTLVFLRHLHYNRVLLGLSFLMLKKKAVFFGVLRKLLNQNF